MPKPTGLRTGVCWERGSANNTASYSQNKIDGCPQESQETLQVPLGPPKNYLGNFQAEDEELHVVTGDVALGSLENPMMAKEF